VPHLSAVKRTRSDLEMFFLAFCERYGLPRPLVNHCASLHPPSGASVNGSALTGGGCPVLAPQSL
jgi:hypothetical protein